MSQFLKFKIVCVVIFIFYAGGKKMNHLQSNLPNKLPEKTNLTTERRKKEKTNDVIVVSLLKEVQQCRFVLFKQKYFLCSYIFLFGFFFTSGFQLQLGNMHGTKTKIKKERASAGSVSGKKTKPGETGRGRNEGNRPGLIRGGKGKALFFQLPQDTRGV